MTKSFNNNLLDNNENIDDTQYQYFQSSDKESNFDSDSDVNSEYSDIKDDISEYSEKEESALKYLDTMTEQEIDNYYDTGKCPSDICLQKRFYDLEYDNWVKKHDKQCEEGYKRFVQSYSTLLDNKLKQCENTRIIPRSENIMEYFNEYDLSESITNTKHKNWDKPNSKGSLQGKLKKSENSKKKEPKKDIKNFVLDKTISYGKEQPCVKQEIAMNCDLINESENIDELQSEKILYDIINSKKASILDTLEPVIKAKTESEIALKKQIENKNLQARMLRKQQEEKKHNELQELQRQFQDKSKKVKKTEMCSYFVRGACIHSNCKFAHSENELDIVDCYEFENCLKVSQVQKGVYENKGNNICLNIHLNESRISYCKRLNIQIKPKTLFNPNKPIVAKMCKWSDRCRYMSNCNFAHKKSDYNVPNCDYGKNCLQFKNGSGFVCFRLHENEDINSYHDRISKTQQIEPSKRDSCKFYRQNGYCNFGANCKFSH